MVFIKPTILRNERDSLNVSGTKYNDTRDDELEYIRTQQFSPHVQDSLLPALHSADLPRPFSHPPVIARGPVNPKLMTK